MTVASKVLASCALVLAFSSHALADQREQADAAFKRGREAFKAERYQEACDAFDESYALDPQLGTKFNLAQCYEHVGKLATAHTMYKELLAIDQNTVRKGLTEDALRSLEPRIPRIQVVIDKPPPDLVVTLQDAKGVGRPIAPNDPVFVDVGTYKVIAVGTGVRDWTSPTTTANQGQTTQVVVVFVPAEAKKPEGPSYSIWHPASRKRLRAAGIIAGGGALVVTSLIFGYSAYSYHSDATDACGDETMCPLQSDVVAANELRDKGELRGTVSTVLFGLGVAAIGTGTVMYLLAKHEGPAVSPQVNESGAGVTISGRF